MNLEGENNGMADTHDIETKFEEDVKNKMRQSGSTNVHYLDWLVSGKAKSDYDKGRTDWEEEKEGMLGGTSKRRDVIGNALRAGAAAKKYNLSTNNRRLSENTALEKYYLDSGMGDGNGMAQSSTIWCPPANSDLPTPQGRMLANLGGKLRAMMGPNQQSREGIRELLTSEFGGQVRNCKSYTDVSGEESEKAKLTGKNTNSAEKLLGPEKNDKRESVPSQTKDKVNRMGNDNEPLEFHNIGGQNKMAPKNSTSSIGFKFFRMRTKSEVNKRETIYKNE